MDTRRAAIITLGINYAAYTLLSTLILLRGEHTVSVALRAGCLKFIALPYTGAGPQSNSPSPPS